MIELLKGIFYNPTDHLPYTTRIKGSKKVGTNYRPISTISSNGYYQVWDNGKYKLWHRLVYQHFKGKIEDNLVIDHLDGNKQNNNPSNLNATTLSINTAKGKPRYNSTGFTGVSQTKYNKFMAKIKVNGKSINLGQYDTPRQAFEVYKEAKRKYFGDEALIYIKNI